MNARSRTQNNPGGRLRKWFSSWRRRHDPWLVFNMFTFTFPGQPLHVLNRLASDDDAWRQAGFRCGIGHKKCGNIRNFRGATLGNH